jgi:acyl-CoA synthetase (AMP-forming)/AMP-acid ligase II
MFGWKFWCIVCGAAPLDPDLEAFWRKLGFLVVQGYGLTETAPIVTLNHPLRASRGTVGRPISGVEVKIAPDGEILVRGENVTQGYYAPGGGQTPVFQDGWFHTGDIGSVDDSGRLRIKGRKKEMIVTPQGLNVFPEDVERALTAQAGVKDAAVVGVAVNGDRTWYQPRGRRARGERHTRRPSAGLEHVDLADGLTPENRRHTEAEAARDPALGGRREPGHGRLCRPWHDRDRDRSPLCPES